MNSHCFKLYRAYSISFTSSNVGKCFWSWILKGCIKVQEKKRKLLSCVPVFEKTWIQALSRCSRATTAKKCTEKAWCTCKVVVLLIKPIAFLPFSLPSPSSLLKLPIDGWERHDDIELRAIPRWLFRCEGGIRLAADEMTSKLVARFRVTGKPGLFYKTSVHVERAEFL